jgi:hypothetical protein
MRKLKIEATFTYDNEMMHDDNKEGIKWFYNLLKQKMFLHNNDIGDVIGEIKITRIKK